ncbi:glycosyltransferase [Lunatibacter salilacus]|uniref:glycosyltransferase n=1 Tax=Lunatibacter salilacus TaxID=2483804 RepID=UPI00131B7667|nr:glycosyltransferase [Lunatibacter salilacus]
MRVVYLLNSLNALGGISTITNKKIEWLIINQGYDVCVIVKWHYSPYEERFNGKLKIYSLEKSYHSINSLEKIQYSYYFFKRVRKIISDFNADICISLLSSIDFFILPFVRISIPKILEIHASATIIIQRSFFIKRFFYMLYSNVVVLNDLEKTKYNLKNIQVIPNFVSMSQYRFDDLNKKNIIISGGRNDKLKQYDHQILAWNKIYDKFDDWEYHIYINDENEKLKEYYSLIEKNCFNLKIFPAVNNFPDKLKESSILVLTSKSESFSIMILEAFNSYNAVISYQTFSGPINLLDNNLGILIKMNDVDNLASSILNLIKNEKIRRNMTLKAKEKVKEYSTELIMKQWLILFNKIINSK